jgi:hypothetical protein
MIEPDPKLVLVAEAVADGWPVDWKGVAAQNPELARELRRLEWIERLAMAYRTVPGNVADRNETTAPLPPARGRTLGRGREA